MGVVNVSKCSVNVYTLWPEVGGALFVLVWLSQLEKVKKGEKSSNHVVINQQPCLFICHLG